MISNFISQVKTRGLARINRYEVLVPFPTAAASQPTIEVANLFCDSVTLPGVNISTNPSRIFGEARELPYEKIFDPVTFTFYVDSDMSIRHAFDRWMALIIDPVNRTVGYYKDYTRDIAIYVKTVENSSPYKIMLYEAYPKNISSVTLDTNGREVMKMTVTMQYKYWYSYAMDARATGTPGNTVGSQSTANSRSVASVVAGFMGEDQPQVTTGASIPDEVYYDGQFYSDFYGGDFDAPYAEVPESRMIDDVQQIRDSAFRDQLLAQTDIDNTSEFDLGF